MKASTGIVLFIGIGALYLFSRETPLVEIDITDPQDTNEDPMPGGNANPPTDFQQGEDLNNADSGSLLNIRDLLDAVPQESVIDTGPEIGSRLKGGL